MMLPVMIRWSKSASRKPHAKRRRMNTMRQHLASRRLGAFRNQLYGFGGEADRVAGGAPRGFGAASSGQARQLLSRFYSSWRAAPDGSTRTLRRPEPPPFPPFWQVQILVSNPNNSPNLGRLEPPIATPMPLIRQGVEDPAVTETPAGVMAARRKSSLHYGQMKLDTRQ